MYNITLHYSASQFCLKNTFQMSKVPALVTEHTKNVTLNKVINSSMKHKMSMA